jgi:hypothetical protein
MGYLNTLSMLAGSFYRLPDYYAPRARLHLFVSLVNLKGRLVVLQACTSNNSIEHDAGFQLYRKTLLAYFQII